MSHPKKRKHLLVGGPLQTRMLILVLMAATVSAMLQGALMAWSLGRLAENLPSDGLAVQEELGRVLVTSTVLALVLLVPSLFALTLVGTHRIFGPLYRFRSFLAGVVDGSEKNECRLRKGDAFQDTCELLNHVSRHMREGNAAQAAPSADEATELRRSA